MERNSGLVKPRRPYASARRQEQARQTREAILDVARVRFLADGFAATTVAAIAGEVGVSVDTIYKSFGGKPGLVRAIWEKALAGEGPVHAEARSDALQTTERDPLVLMRGIGRLVAEVAPRGAPVMMLLGEAAATDPEMAALKAELDEQRLRRMTHNAGNLARAGHLRQGLSVEEAGEIMWTYTSEALYKLLVVTRGWSIDRFATFVADAVAAALLPAATLGRGPAEG